MPDVETERVADDRCPKCSRLTHASDSNDDGVCVTCLGTAAILPSPATQLELARLDLDNAALRAEIARLESESDRHRHEAARLATELRDVRAKLTAAYDTAKRLDFACDRARETIAALERQVEWHQPTTQLEDAAYHRRGPIEPEELLAGDDRGYEPESAQLDYAGEHPVGGIL